MTARMDFRSVRVNRPKANLLARVGPDRLAELQTEARRLRGQGWSYERIGRSGGGPAAGRPRAPLRTRGLWRHLRRSCLRAVRPRSAGPMTIAARADFPELTLADLQRWQASLWRGELRLTGMTQAEALAWVESEMQRRTPGKD